MQHRYEGNIFSGEKRSELLVVPALSVRVTPQVAIVPASRSAAAAAPCRPRPTGRGAAAAPRRGRVAAGRGSGRRGRRAARRRAGRRIAKCASRLSTTRRPRQTRGEARAAAGLDRDAAEQPVKFARSDESQTVRFR